jgi:hypothetical protein
MKSKSVWTLLLGALGGTLALSRSSRPAPEASSADGTPVTGFEAHLSRALFAAVAGGIPANLRRLLRGIPSAHAHPRRLAGRVNPPS